MTSFRYHPTLVYVNPPSHMRVQEIEKLWKMVDAAHEKESRARDTVNQLKMEIANLTKLVEQGAGLSFGQDARYKH